MIMTLRKLGTVEKAELELGNLTIICGNNNYGKTYATYALYGALKYLQSAFSVIAIDAKYVDELYEKGMTVIPLSKTLESLPKIIRAASDNYSKRLSKVFAAKPEHFSESQFSLDIPTPSKSLYRDSERNWSYRRNARWHFSFSAEKMEVVVQAGAELRDVNETPSRQITKNIIETAIQQYLLRPIIPDVYLSSTERTGVVMFQRELDFTRNRLLEALGDKARNLSPELLYSEFHGDYPLPVRDNVDFIRNLQSIEKNEGELFLKHPEIYNLLSEIVGGTYKATKDGFIFYIPSKGPRGTKLGLAESSSSVRALLDVAFYLKHAAEAGDLFMIDEPEMNLHPSNQRKLARLLARLVNAGIKVFMTTHSDYIIKEINTLILLKQDGEQFKTIAKEEKYFSEELLDASQVRVYVAGDAPMQKKGNIKRTRCHTFIPAGVSQNMGIEIASFDSEIDSMNRIQDRILWETE